MVGLTYKVSNMHRVVDDINDPYRNMIMDAIWINQGHTGHCSFIDEELNVNVTGFFYLLKYSDKPIWDDCRNHIKLLIVT